MLRPFFILSLAAVALAATMDYKSTMEQVIRVGSVGTAFANVKGVLVPTTPTFTEAYPAYVFRSVVNGAPVVETEHISFRCSLISDFYVSHAEAPKPVLICRNYALEKGSVMDTTAEKRVFLFSAEDFTLPSGVSDIELSFGKNLMKTFMTAYSTGFVPAGSGIVSSGIVSSTTRSLGKYDDYKISTALNLYDTMLSYDIPMHRNKRQFGGFGASGSQASAGSFAGGAGGGGFQPFGGSGSGSFASSNSFGAGGGGFLG